MFRAVIAALAAALLLSPAIAGSQTPSEGDQSPPANATTDPNQRLLTPEQQGRQGVVNGVVEQPFRDFNVMRSKIPPVLTRAIADPYARPPPGCQGVAGEVSELNRALGPDLDEPVSTEHPGTLTRVEGTAKTGALDAMRSGVQSEIPFDGFIRMLSGAQRHDKLVMAAIQAGAIRRGYLKGLGESLHCTLPAAPRHLAHPADISAR